MSKGEVSSWRRVLRNTWEKIVSLDGACPGRWEPEEDARRILLGKATKIHDCLETRSHQEPSAETKVLDQTKEETKRRTDIKTGSLWWKGTPGRPRTFTLAIGDPGKKLGDSGGKKSKKCLKLRKSRSIGTGERVTKKNTSQITGVIFSRKGRGEKKM